MTNKIKFNKPQTLTAIEYSSIYGEQGKEDSVADCLKDIPTAVILHYILMEHSRIHFAMNSPQLHSEAIAKLWHTLPKKLRPKLSAHQRKQKSLLFDSYATLHICYEALRNFVSMDVYGDNDINPAKDELENIYRAYLKCNSYWTSKQKPHPDLIDLSLGIEVPFIEFKNHKKFVTAAYKAFQFFEFCEKDPSFKSYIDQMLKDLGVKDWREYLALFLNLYSLVIKSPYVKFDKETSRCFEFFRQFAVDIIELKKIGEWDGDKSLKYLRDHFLVDFDKDVLLILSPDLVCDKLYQGLKFIMWASIRKHGLKHPNGKDFKSFQEFLGLLGNNFSEKHLMEDVIRKSLTGHVDSIYTDEDIRNANISSPSDFYIKKGDSLILVEYKDALFPDDAKLSGDIEKIKEKIREKICLDKPKSEGSEKRDLKGVGQLLDTIARIANGEYDQLDPSYKDIKYIYPVVVTTDLTFSALGVNAYVAQQTAEIIRRHNESLRDSGIFIYVPTIIDIDSWIDMSYRMSKGELDFFQSLRDYIHGNDLNLQSFRVFVEDKIVKTKILSPEELHFLIPSLPIG